VNAILSSGTGNFMHLRSLVIIFADSKDEWTEAHAGSYDLGVSSRL